MTRRVQCCLVCASVVWWAACGARHTQEVLILVADVPLPGASARFDYQSLDTVSNRLYIAHMRGDQLIVFDVVQRKVIAAVPDLPGATGVWAIPELHRVYVSVTGHHQVAAIDDRDFRIVARHGPVHFPDGVAYAPAQQKVYVSDEFGQAEIVIDATSDRIAGRIALGAEAGNTKYDATNENILVAAQTSDEVVVIDPVTDRIVDRFSYGGADHPHGLQVDERDQLLFVANQGSGRLSVLDLRTHALLSEHTVGRSPDVLAFDANRGLLYVGAESGRMSVFRVQGKTVTRAGQLRLAHAHTVAVDPRDGLVYLPLENVEGRPVLRIMTPSRDLR